MCPTLRIASTGAFSLLLQVLCGNVPCMSDFDSRDNTRPPNEETFQPGAAITPDGVTLFATDFRAQALREGVLVDVSETARSVGFVYPTAVTARLWADIQTIPEEYAG